MQQGRKEGSDWRTGNMHATATASISIEQDKSFQIRDADVAAYTIYYMPGQKRVLLSLALEAGLGKTRSNMM